MGRKNGNEERKRVREREERMKRLKKKGERGWRERKGTEKGRENGKRERECMGREKKSTGNRQQGMNMLNGNGKK